MGERRSPQAETWMPALTRQVSSAPPASFMTVAASALAACAAARPLTLTPESAGTRPRRESGTESREAQAPQVSKHSRLKDPEWVPGIPP